jgi:hypothetical protein
VNQRIVVGASVTEATVPGASDVLLPPVTGASVIVIGIVVVVVA